MSVLNTPQDPRHQVTNPMKEGLYRIIPLAAVILGFVLVAANYQSLPEEIPMHFNARGEVDSYGNKLMLWGLPVINFALFYFLSKISQSGFKWFNYPVPITEANAAVQHKIALELVALMRAITCLMLAYLVFALVRSAQLGTSMLNMWFFGGLILALFAAIGWKTYEAYQAK